MLTLFRSNLVRLLSLDEHASDPEHTENILLNKNFALAVSGGADSMCLALLTKLSNIKNAYCLIVDHKLRQNSTIDAEETKRYLESKFGLPTKILTWEHNESIKSNIHQHARKGRYHLLSQFCLEQGLEYLVTAHNYDDQAETIFMRILRGSGIDGICGIPEYNVINQIRVLRPMLSLNRRNIETFLQENSVRWIDDITNEDLRYERAKIRQIFKVIDPYLGSSGILQKRLTLLGENAKRAKDFLDQETKQAIESVVWHSKLGYALLNSTRFSKLHKEIALRILRNLLMRIGGGAFIARLKQLQKLYAQITKWTFVTSVNNPGVKFNKKTLGGCCICDIGDGNLLFMREKELVDNKLIPIRCDEEVLWDKRFIVKLPCVFANQNKFFFVSVMNMDCWRYLKPQIKSYFQMELPCPMRNIPYQEIMLSTPVIYEESGSPLYYVAINQFDHRFYSGI